MFYVEHGVFYCKIVQKGLLRYNGKTDGADLADFNGFFFLKVSHQKTFPTHLSISRKNIFLLAQSKTN